MLDSETKLNILESLWSNLNQIKDEAVYCITNSWKFESFDSEAHRDDFVSYLQGLDDARIIMESVILGCALDPESRLSGLYQIIHCHYNE